MRLEQARHLPRRLEDTGGALDKEFYLCAPGYFEFASFWREARESHASWMEMHDMDGEISESNISPNYSVFRLEGGTGKKDIEGQGLLLTDVDLDKVEGCRLRKAAEWWWEKAQAQRAFYLSLVNSPERLKHIQGFEEEGELKKREKQPMLFAPLEELIIHTSRTGLPEVSPLELSKVSLQEHLDYKDFGYDVRFSPMFRSREEMVMAVDSMVRSRGLNTRIGKYQRSILTLAPMPDASGSVDAVTTVAMCNMLAVIPRNFEFKDIDRQVNFTGEVLKYLENFQIPRVTKKEADQIKQIWRRNIGAAIGVGEEDIERFKKLYEVGVRSFRLYTVSTDTRARELCKVLVSKIRERQSPENPVEFFVGQITTIAQFEDLVTTLGNDWNLIDGVYIGNGGGTRCGTGETGMIVESLLLSYQLRNHSKMKGKSIIIEGGVGNEPAFALAFADGLSYAGNITGGCFEAPGGQIYIQDNKGVYWKPYRGEASPSGKIIEGHLYPSGDAVQVEGVNGFIRMEKKYPSMCARIWRLNEFLAQSFVKLGVENIQQLHALGVPMRREELEQIFDLKLEKIPDVVQLDLADLKIEGGNSYWERMWKSLWRKYLEENTDYPNLKEPLYIIPFPFYKRSEAQRQVAKPYPLISGEFKKEER